MDAPFFSVIIPVYNVERYLACAVDSVLGQDFSGDAEIILVDDGSTDSSGKICDDYAARYPQVKVFHKNNAGQAIARNVGLKVAEGEYIVFLDSDDWLERDAFRVFQEALLKHSKADLLGFLFQKVSENGNTLLYRTPLWRCPVESSVNVLEIASKLDLSMSVCAYVYKHEFLAHEQLSFVEGILQEDAEFAIHALLLAKEGVFLNYHGYNYRTRAGSTMECKGVAHLRKRFEDYLFIFGSLKENVKKFGENSIQYLAMRRQCGQLVFAFAWELYSKPIPASDVRKFLAALKEMNLLPLPCNLGSRIYSLWAWFVSRKLPVFFVRLLQRSLSWYTGRRQKGRGMDHPQEIKSENPQLVRTAAGANEEKLQLFLASNEDFFEHACITILSVVCNTCSPVHINILTSNLSPNVQNQLVLLNKIRPFSIDFIHVDENMFKDFTSKIKRIGKAAFYRLAIAGLRPDLKKAIYLDSDMIIRTDIRTLWEEDIQDVYAGVVEDLIPREQILFPNERYFNAGVLLLNLERIRRDFSIERFVEIDRENPGILRYQDQDILNIAWSGRVKYLDFRWNVGAACFMKLPQEHRSKEAEIKRACMDARIVHFTGMHKPWIYPASEFPEAYVYEYFKYWQIFEPNKRIVAPIFQRACLLMWRNHILDILRVFKRNPFGLFLAEQRAVILRLNRDFCHTMKRLRRMREKLCLSKKRDLSTDHIN
ncbi:MAG: glycosyltransferase [Puniceicoccales bacterium]|jgi:lipopolysaccharide biosynthesis glycosyltransferase/glycosyltransferase involved in cell wall biosynthesis|nr:glycosyltransferase [Puniceicoccales bacterium]